jgi:hypothetical protein
MAYLPCFNLSEQSKSRREFVMWNRTLKPSDEPSDGPNIGLTLAVVTEANPSGAGRIPASRLLAYDQQLGFTRLKLTGGAVLDVRETTSEIDWLVRTAAHRNPTFQ